MATQKVYEVTISIVQESDTADAINRLLSQLEKRLEEAVPATLGRDNIYLVSVAEQ